VYGDADPALTYVVSGLKFSDSEAQALSGFLTRVAGENVGNYAIGQGTLAANANYTLSFQGNDLAISPATLTVSADHQSKVYGDADPALTYVVSGLRFSDSEAQALSGFLTRVAGENVGSYAIGQGTLAANANYAISFQGNDLAISPATLTVSADHQSKVYGDADPALTYVVSGLKFSDSEAQVLSGLLARAAGENVGSYAIGQGTLAANANYTLSFQGNDLAITPATLTVSADAKSKVYGDSDPALTYTITSGSLVGSDAFSGALSRAPSEDVGSYAIGQGSLSAGGNYTIIYVGANLSITKADIGAGVAVPPPSAADDGAAHTATRTAAGAGGVDLDALMGRLNEVGTSQLPSLLSAALVQDLDFQPQLVARAGDRLTPADPGGGDEQALADQGDTDQHELADVQGVDFGDGNGDGVWSEGEPPMSGRTVRLVNETGEVVAETRTGPEGEYRFVGVPAGQYRVEAEAGPEWEGAVSQAFTVHTGTVTVDPLGQHPSGEAAEEGASPADKGASPAKEPAAPTTPKASDAVWMLLGAVVPAFHRRRVRSSARDRRWES
jgi:hypothetical protein